MSEPLLFIEKLDFEQIVNYKDKCFQDNPNYPLKGIVLMPSGTDDGDQVYYLNPVYESPDGIDVVQVVNKEATCPYPPGYPAK